MVARHILTPDSQTVKVELLNGNAGLRGSFAVHFSYPEKRSFLAGDFIVRQGAVRTPFRGQVVDWLAPDHLLQKSEERWITPELRVVSDVSLSMDQAVVVQFYAGPLIINTLTLSQGANDATVTSGFHVATVQIKPGMTLHLQPATPLQDGQIYIDGDFSSSNLPDVHYAGAIVVWHYLHP